MSMFTFCALDIMASTKPKQQSGKKAKAKRCVWVWALVDIQEGVLSFLIRLVMV